MTSKREAYLDDLLAECYAYFEQGFCFDEGNDQKNALKYYDRGLTILKMAEEYKECKYNEKYKSICNSRKKIEKRLKAMKKNKQTKGSKGNVDDEKKLKQVGTDEKCEKNWMNEMKEQLQTISFPEAELVYLIPKGVQLFMIENGDVTVPTMPCSLEVYKMPPGTESVNADAFIKVGPWTYPLKSGSIPILKNEFGAFVVPNPTPDHQELYVGILLPSDLDGAVEEGFIKVLKEYAVFREVEVAKELTKEERKRMSEKIADWLIRGSENIASGINYVAEKTSEMVVERTSRVRSSITPNEKPMHVNLLIRTGVYCVHGSSKVVAKCTRYLLDKIGEMGVSVGQSLANSAEKGFGESKGGRLVTGTINVLAGGITGVSTIWISLENASKTLCRNIADETVETVKQKYGDEASVTAHKALYATGHTTLAALQLYDLGPRSIATRAARKAGVQFIQTLHNSDSETSLKAIEKVQ
uniref:Senescence domain-containing protein n=1 Tax=Syphacia muris TaxID=451379 RepID=A0A0N5AJA2_9BILA